jgi:hypothetical protein
MRNVSKHYGPHFPPPHPLLEFPKPQQQNANALSVQTPNNKMPTLYQVVADFPDSSEITT